MRRAGIGWDEGVVGTTTVETDVRSQAGFTLQQSNPVVVTDLATEHRFQGSDLLLDHDVTSGISVIIGERERPFGVLGVHTRQERTFSVSEINFVQTVANALATVVERREAESALRHSEEQYRLLFESNPRPMWVYDPETLRFSQVNDAAVETYGYSEAEFKEMTLFDIRPESEYARLETNLNRPRQRMEHSGPWLHQKRDGAIMEVETDSHVIELEDEAILVVVHDVTERNQVARENARLVEDLRAMSMRLIEAQEQERRRIARELHDEAGALLTSLQICLDTAARHVSTPSPEKAVVQEELGEAQELTDTLSTHVRQMALNLRPSVLDDLGLAAALQRLADRHRKLTDLDVHLYHELEKNERFSESLETAAYRIVQEALTNASRYADVDEVQVMVNVLPDALRIHVVDEGIGFDLERTQKERATIGLLSMRERAELLQGTLEIATAPGEGTRISATLPI